MRRWRRATAVAVATLLTAAPPVAAFTLRPVAPSVVASGLARGADGRMWFTDADRGTVGRVDARGRVERLRAWPRDEGEPFGITAAPDGNVWFLDRRARWVGRATPAGRITIFRTGLAGPDTGFADGLMPGPDHALWFAVGKRVGRVSATGAVRLFDAPPALSRRRLDFGLRGPVHGEDGRAWFVTATSLVAVGRGGGMRRYPLGEDDWFGAAIARGPDGHIWVLGPHGARSVSPSGRVRVVTRAPLGAAYGTPSALRGPAGHLWVATTTGKVAELTRSGRITLHGPPRSTIVDRRAFMPQALAVGPAGDLWIAGGGAGLSRAVLAPACGVPDLDGRSEQVARRRLRAAGCTARVVRRGGRAGALVLRQSARAGSVLPRRARVTIVVGRPAPGCRFPERSTILARSAEVVVATRTVLHPPTATLRESHRVQTWWACLRSAPKLQRLEVFEDDGYGAFRLGPVTLSGSRVTYTAVEDEDHYGDARITVTSRDLSSATSPIMFAIGRSDAGSPPFVVRELAATPAGAIAWLADDNDGRFGPGRRTTIELRTPDGLRRVLAQGPSGPLAYLRLDLTTAFWQENGQERSTPIG